METKNGSDFQTNDTRMAKIRLVIVEIYNIINNNVTAAKQKAFCFAIA